MPKPTTGESIEVQHALRDLLQKISTRGDLDEYTFQKIVHFVHSTTHGATITRSNSGPADLDEDGLSGPSIARHDDPGSFVPTATTRTTVKPALAQPDPAVSITAVEPDSVESVPAVNDLQPQRKRKRDKIAAFAKEALSFVGIVTCLLGFGGTIEGLVGDF